MNLEVYVQQPGLPVSYDTLCDDAISAALTVSQPSLSIEEATSPEIIQRDIIAFANVYKGPQGPQGEQGLQGETGPAGPGLTSPSSMPAAQAPLTSHPERKTM